MISIKKIKPPHDVLTFCIDKSIPLNIHDPFDNPSIKNSLRQSLLIEQRHLCGYCMGRVTMESSVIEHVLPKSSFPTSARTYNNVILTCDNKNNHCDKSKGNRTLNLTHKKMFSNIEDYIYYNFKGEIHSFNKDIETDLISSDILNLNGYEYLLENRRKVMKEFENYVSKLIKKKNSKKRVIDVLNINMNRTENISILPSYFGVYKWLVGKYAK